MADKKVERSRRERTQTPTQKMNSALSEPGTMNVAEISHDKGKAALVDKFRRREERWRTEQSLHDQQVAREAAESGESAAGDLTAEVNDKEPAEDRTEGGEA